MIQYTKSAFGLGLLLRVNGSAVYRSILPGILSAVCVIVIRSVGSDDSGNGDGGNGSRSSVTFRESLSHPYAVGVLVGTLTFLLVFRVQQGYARYWEGCGSVHHMMSKWLDAVVHTAAFHMQCEHYDSIKPPSFFDYPLLNRAYMTRSRERYGDDDLGILSSVGRDSRDETERLHKRSRIKSINSVNTNYLKNKHKIPVRATGLFGISPVGRLTTSDLGEPVPLEGPGRMDGNWGPLFKDGKATFFDPRRPEELDPAGFAGLQGGRTPPLFLQELAHLASLLVGVALSTLRNDVEGAESPLDIYEPGAPWPSVDPDRDDAGALANSDLTDNASPMTDSGQYRPSHGFNYTIRQRIFNFIGIAKSDKERTKYNAARPMPVLGGVSEGEIRFLQIARGPSAKTQLCWYWLSEFITREHLAGTLGDVGPPIISRIIQFLGDGMIHYNHARKVMFIPFPFPHAQLSVFYVIAAIPVVAVLMDQFAEEIWSSCILAFLTVTCLSGIHEVARELENPFRNVPNEIPLVTLQAQFNEALITMYAGYHPDHFWGEHADEFTEQQQRNGAKPMKATLDELARTPRTESPNELGNPSKVKERSQRFSRGDDTTRLMGEANDGNTDDSTAASMVQELVAQLQQQKEDTNRRMEQMKRQQELESERQRKELQKLRSQLEAAELAAKTESA